jgi:hypothetical protein
MAQKKDIRINLRFGARSDPDLVAELLGLAPRERARWARAWLIEGWRIRSAHARPHAIPPPMRSTSVQADVTPKDGMFNLLGKRIL